eukprot:GHRR01025920.1.p1 GENE.GHRR01025920.1~~GHRR01025920.1.p1  ORF type:complete len:221 (+),score=45.30 GHRR01025920.1:628-1290(+)
MSAKRPTKPRGELAELSAQLQGLCMTGKRSNVELRQAKKEAFKKVINYMTLGMDMSGLFPMMTSCANLSPDDIVLKKMLYLYITHYAASTPDLALLTINQLHKDCHDQDPTVRGLALRSLCSLRISNLLEYVVRSCACSKAVDNGGSEQTRLHFASHHQGSMVTFWHEWANSMKACTSGTLSQWIVTNSNGSLRSSIAKQPSYLLNMQSAHVLSVATASA